MTLEALQKDMIMAMKAGDKARKEVIASLVGAVKKAGIDKKCKDNIPEAIVNEVLIKEQKTAQEMLDTCPADRIDLIEKYTFNMSVIKEYAPQLATDPEEIKSMIADIVGYDGVTNKTRGLIMKSLKGKADMAIVNKIVQEML